MCGLMILEHIKVKISMARHLWDIEFDRVYKEILHEYIDDGWAMPVENPDASHIKEKKDDK